MYFKIENVINLNMLWWGYRLKRDKKWIVKQYYYETTENFKGVTIKDAEKSTLVDKVLYPFSAKSKEDAKKYTHLNSSKKCILK